MAVRSGTNGQDFFDLYSPGLDGADTYFTMNGSDTIYAGYGADAVYAGNDNDYIYADADPRHRHLGDYGADWAYGEGGNDTLDYSNNLTSNGRLYGDFHYAGAAAPQADGVDHIYGGHGDETIWGGGNNDFLYGGDGDDYIHGDYGFSTTNYTVPVPGYMGNDLIVGGRGADHMSGDGGFNTFVINAGDSGNDSPIYGLTQYTTDYIDDFNTSQDKLDLPIAGTQWNTESVWTSGNWDTLTTRDAAEADMRTLGKTYVFLSGYSHEGDVGGTLYADLNGDHHADMAVRMEGVTQLPWYDIV
jgi:Ca2+-binding RTX toxin-like protein